MPIVDNFSNERRASSGISQSITPEIPAVNDSVVDGFVIPSSTHQVSVSHSASMTFSNPSNTNQNLAGVVLSEQETRLYNKLKDVMKENRKLKRAMAQNNEAVREQVDRIATIVQNQVLRIKDLTMKLEGERSVSRGLKSELCQLKDVYASERERHEDFDMVEKLNEYQGDLNNSMQAISAYIDDMKSKDAVSELCVESIGSILNQLTAMQATQDRISGIVTSLSNKQIVDKINSSDQSELQTKLEDQSRVVAQKEEELANVKTVLLEREKKLMDTHILLSQMQSENEKLNNTSVEFTLVSAPNHEQEVASLASQLYKMTAERDALKEEMQAQIEEHKEVCNTFEDIEDENARLQQEISILKDKHVKNSSYINELVAEVGSLKDQLAKDEWSLVGETAREGEMKKKDTEIQQLKQCVESFSYQLTQVIQERDKMKGKFLSQHQALDKLNVDYVKLYESLQHKTCKLATEENKVCQLNARADKCYADANESKEQLKSCQEELLQSKKAAESKSEEFEAMKIQLDMYKEDFQEERRSKERVHSELMKVRDEVSNLTSENKRLREDLEKGSSQSVSDLQRRHQNQSRSSFDSPNRSPFSSAGSDRAQYAPYNNSPYVDQAASSYGDHAPQPYYNAPPYVDYSNQHGAPTYVDHGNQSMQQPMPYPQSTKPPVFHGRGSVNYQPDSFAPHHPDTFTHTNMEDRYDSVRECPKCNKVLPDSDSLQGHVLECLDN